MWCGDPLSFDRLTLGATVVGFLLVAVVALFFTAFPQPGTGDNRQISINEVAAGVRSGDIRRITVRDDRLDIEYQDNRKATSRKDANVGITQQLRDYGVTPDQLEGVSIQFQDPPQFGNVLQILINGVSLYRNGTRDRDRSEADLSGREIEIVIDLNVGDAEATVLTTDLSHDYVEENSAYSS